MSKTCDVLVIFTNDEILAVILGRGQGVFTKLKKHKVWELILEDLLSMNLTEKDVSYLDVLNFYNENIFDNKMKLFSEELIPH